MCHGTRRKAWHGWPGGAGGVRRTAAGCCRNAKSKCFIHRTQHFHLEQYAKTYAVNFYPEPEQAGPEPFAKSMFLCEVVLLGLFATTWAWQISLKSGHARLFPTKYYKSRTNLSFRVWAKDTSNEGKFTLLLEESSWLIKRGCLLCMLSICVTQFVNQTLL